MTHLFHKHRGNICVTKVCDAVRIHLREVIKTRISNKKTLVIWFLTPPAPSAMESSLEQLKEI